MLSAQEIKQKLEDAGLKVDGIDAQSRSSDRIFDCIARVDLDGRKIELLIQVKERPHLVSLRLAAEEIKRYADPDRIPMVAARFMGPHRRALLKDMGIGYMDMAGNMYLRASGIFIEREGKRNPFGYTREGLNPYSDKASVILRILMDEPKRVWRIREIANHGGVNPGWVSRVVEDLVERGLVQFSRERGVALLRGEDMLKEWADLYDWRRNKMYYYYCQALDSREVLDRIAMLDLDGDAMVALGFQSGAYLVSPYATFNQVHLIIDGISFDTVRPQVERQLKLESRREGANLILVRPYYKHSALYGVRKIERWRVVSDIQLYLDLNKYPIRGREQAEHLLEKIIRPELSKEAGGKRGSKRD